MKIDTGKSPRLGDFNEGGAGRVQADGTSDGGNKRKRCKTMIYQACNPPITSGRFNAVGGKEKTNFPFHKKDPVIAEGGGSEAQRTDITGVQGRKSAVSAVGVTRAVGIEKFKGEGKYSS